MWRGAGMRPGVGQTRAWRVQFWGRGGCGWGVGCGRTPCGECTEVCVCVCLGAGGVGGVGSPYGVIPDAAHHPMVVSTEFVSGWPHERPPPPAPTLDFLSVRLRFTHEQRRCFPIEGVCGVGVQQQLGQEHLKHVDEICMVVQGGMEVQGSMASVRAGRDTWGC